MHTTHPTPHLTRIERRFPFSTNVYLVHERHELTLIDTGLPGTAHAILRAAHALGAPITRIVLTHAHADHTGSLDELKARLPHAEVSVGTREARLLAGERTLDADEPRDRLRGGYTRPATRPDRLLDPGDRVGSLEVIAAPGHTPGSLAFLDTRDGTLVAGDAYVTQGGLHASGMLRLAFPISPLVTYHKPLALATARRLRDLHPARLAVGHGPVLDRPGDAMSRVVDAYERALSRA